MDYSKIIELIIRNRPNATKQEIQLAHRKMLMKYHPDHGGSTEMASKINQARDVLLGKDLFICWNKHTISQKNFLHNHKLIQPIQ